ncbi:MAG: sugar nucleotide-binding protein [Anaerolineae bacterium]|nr:sugar nucleotide-binding protein [Anaerolineae bacterium]
MRRLLIVGHKGLLGSTLMREFHKRPMEDVQVFGVGREATEGHFFPSKIYHLDVPAIIINAAGNVKGRSDCKNSEMVMDNAVLPHRLAEHPNCQRIIQVSTDCVFNGKQRGTYSEFSDASPSDLYGRSKLAGELIDYPNALTVRTSFVGWGRRNLLGWLASQPQNAEIEGYLNWFWNGAYVGVVARILLDLALDSEITGLLHLEFGIWNKSDLLRFVAETIRPDIRINPVYHPKRIDRVLTSEWNKAMYPVLDYDPDSQFDGMFEDWELFGKAIFATKG